MEKRKTCETIDTDENDRCLKRQKTQAVTESEPDQDCQSNVKIEVAGLGTALQDEKAAPCWIYGLPEEIMLIIFGSLSIADLSSVSITSPSWRRLSLDACLISLFPKAKFAEELRQLDKTKKVLQYAIRVLLQSSKAIRKDFCLAIFNELLHVTKAAGLTSLYFSFFAHLTRLAIWFLDQQRKEWLPLVEVIGRLWYNLRTIKRNSELFYPLLRETEKLTEYFLQVNIVDFLSQHDLQCEEADRIQWDASANINRALNSANTSNLPDGHLNTFFGSPLDHFMWWSLDHILDSNQDSPILERTKSVITSYWESQDWRARHVAISFIISVPLPKVAIPAWVAEMSAKFAVGFENEHERNKILIIQTLGWMVRMHEKEKVIAKPKKLILETLVDIAKTCPESGLRPLITQEIEDTKSKLQEVCDHTSPDYNSFFEALSTAAPIAVAGSS